MIRILDLFAGTQSVRKAITELFKIYSWSFTDGVWYGQRLEHIGSSKTTVEYIGIDIYSPEFQNIHFDLTQDNIVEKLKEVLPENWIPHFIWASPVCNKFSTAVAATGGNLFFEIDYETETIKPRTNFGEGVSMNKIYKKPENWTRYTSEAELALVLHENTKKIIDYYNVPFIIENPRRALSRYLYKEYTHNYTSYCMYGYEYQKPTTIYSNVKINLLDCDHKNKREAHTIMLSGNKKDYTNGRKNMSNYAKRSSVPPKLIKEIIKQLTRGVNIV